MDRKFVIMGGRKLAGKYDLIFILAILAVTSVFLLLAREDAPSVECRMFFDGDLVKTVDLRTDRTFKIPEAPLMEFTVKDGKIAAAYSDCPDKVCVNMGYISHVGQKIVCLPNKIVVSVDSSEQTNADDPDVIAR